MKASFGRGLMVVVLSTAGVLLTASCGEDEDVGFSGSGGGGGVVGGCAVNGAMCPVLCDEQLGCIDCITDADCGAAEPSCIAGECHECGDNNDCPMGESCFPKDHACEPSCQTSDDCPGDAPICDPATGACVGCVGDADCAQPTPSCSPLTKQCVECASNADCGAATPICDIDGGKCEECLVDAHCPPSAQFCVDQECQDNPTMTCAPGLIDCDAAGCVDVSSDPSHCGGCGIDCNGGTCVSGQCSCGPGDIVCNDGCVDPSTDPDHCGGCGNQCDAGVTCVSGNCACAAGAITCNGACVDPAADPDHCGGCGNGCSDLQYCDAGNCACKPGLTAVGNGCVDTSSDPSNCGDVGNQCGGGTPSCQNGACVAGCNGGLTDCGDACVNLDNDPLYCGACDQSCNAAEVCVDGECRDWAVAFGCNSCPCPSQCQGDFGQCCPYPGDPDVIICVDAGGCP